MPTFFFCGDKLHVINTPMVIQFTPRVNFKLVISLGYIFFAPFFFSMSGSSDNSVFEAFDQYDFDKDEQFQVSCVFLIKRLFIHYD